jgi:hypothetical protein
MMNWKRPTATKGTMNHAKKKSLRKEISAGVIGVVQYLAPLQ